MKTKEPGTSFSAGGGRGSRRRLLQDRLGVQRLLGRRDVARRLHELAELGVRDLVFVHEEAIDLRTMGRFFVGPADVQVGSHRELAAGNPDHPLRRRRLIEELDGPIRDAEDREAEEPDQQGPWNARPCGSASRFG